MVYGKDLAVLKNITRWTAAKSKGGETVEILENKKSNNNFFFQGGAGRPCIKI